MSTTHLSGSDRMFSPSRVPPPGPPIQPIVSTPQPQWQQTQDYLGTLTEREVALIVHDREWTHHAPSCPLCQSRWGV